MASLHPFLSRACFLMAMAAAWPYAAGAQDAGAIAGTVRGPGDAAASDAQVELVDLKRRAPVDETGAFRFEGVPAGEYLLSATSPRFGNSVLRVRVDAGQELSVQMTLDRTVHQEAIVVTARPDARGLDEIAQPVTVLAGDELALRLAPTLGETLSQQPGVSSTYFGPGASRPVIRGLGGDRIRILEDGIGVGDASNTSPDHAVSFEPLGAEQIEVVRGPATLLYGSSAVGGVVNVLDGRIPSAGADRGFSGSVDLLGGTASDERGGFASVKAGRGPLVLGGDYLRRKTDDVSIPGFAESEALRAEEEAEGAAHEGEEEEEAFGTLPNSAIDSEGGSLGAALVGRSGFFGLSASGFDTLYGVPGGHAHGEAEHAEGEGAEGEGEEHAEEGPVRVDLQQRRLDLRGEMNRPFGVLRSAKLRFGASNYEHRELEGEEIGTTFNNDAWEGRLDLLHKPAGPMRGALGVQVARREFEAIGAEAFVPPTETNSIAVFAFEEVGNGPVRLQLGARYENQDIDAFGASPATRSFDGFSASAGVNWSGASGYGVGFTVARSSKLPNAEELFSNGPHIATRAFEIGDPDLDKETSLGLDLTLRKRSGPVTGQVNLFANRFDDFIYERLTGEQEDGLAIVQFVQADADFIGAELQGIVELLHREPNHLDLELMADVVRAELRATDEALPRIPPFRYGAGLHYRGARLNGRVELRGVAKQDRLAPFERETEGYTFLNASVGYRFYSGRMIYDVRLQGTNLTDADGRNHVSFLKDLVPLPGRDVRLSLRVFF